MSALEQVIQWMIEQLHAAVDAATRLITGTWLVEHGRSDALTQADRCLVEAARADSATDPEVLLAKCRQPSPADDPWWQDLLTWALHAIPTWAWALLACLVLITAIRAGTRLGGNKVHVHLHQGSKP